MVMRRGNALRAYAVRTGRQRAGGGGVAEAIITSCKSSAVRIRGNLSRREEEEQLREALDRLEQGGIRQVDAAATCASLLRHCSHARALSQGKRLHAHIGEWGYGGDRFLGNLLVQMYGNCGSLRDARA
eukprot:c47461_g1_i1 orf=3-386(-)